jgi:hypothetical protein
MRKKQEKLRLPLNWKVLDFFFFGRSELEIEVEGPLAEEGDKNTKIFLRIANLNRRNNTVDS